MPQIWIVGVETVPAYCYVVVQDENIAVSQKTLDRWTRTMNAFHKMQKELEELFEKGQKRRQEEEEWQDEERRRLALEYSLGSPLHSCHNVMHKHNT